MASINTRLIKAESLLVIAPASLQILINKMKAAYLGVIGQEEYDRLELDMKSSSVNPAEVGILALHELEKQDRLEGTDNMKRVYECIGFDRWREVQSS